MLLNKDQILQQASRYRATLINSLAGYKSAVLIGTKSTDGINNLAIFNSLIHIGANPPMYGMLFRPDTVERHTLRNILDSGYYTLNYPKADDYRKTHQTSAKYAAHQSEFKECGFNAIYLETHPAPFVEEAIVHVGMKFIEKIDIPVNGTILLIGSIEFIHLPDSIVKQDGFVALHEGEILACSGLDAYYKTNFIERLSYAKPDTELTTLSIES